jgi:hypothetical protein
VTAREDELETALKVERQRADELQEAGKKLADTLAATARLFQEALEERDDLKQLFRRLMVWQPIAGAPKDKWIVVGGWVNGEWATKRHCHDACQPEPTWGTLGPHRRVPPTHFIEIPPQPTPPEPEEYSGNNSGEVRE